jgi:hypothetical protein
MNDTEPARFLNGEVLGALASGYVITRDEQLKAKTDKLFGGALGKNGGPESDSVYSSLLDLSTNGCCPKNFGFFHGFGRAFSWPAARLSGTAPQQPSTEPGNSGAPSEGAPEATTRPPDAPARGRTTVSAGTP